MSPVIATLLIVGIIFVLFLFIKFIPIRHWIAAVFSNVKISIFTLIGMRLRRVPAEVVVNALIQAEKAGITVDSNSLEAHFLAGGNVERVINALVAADKANIELSLQRATAIDL
ncbi:MAG: flotillin-like FloA family protein, partial [Victivallaceae bacterium]|nr:flotillin-like FloA family protein [Victivallaceae bacterium]